MMFRIPILLCVLAALSNVSQGDENWPRFRGPNGSGVSSSKTVPVEWSEKDYNWTLDLPGTGNASPVIWNGKLFITSASLAKGSQYLQCVDVATGDVLWEKPYAFKKFKTHSNNSFASNTPCVDENAVYVLWQTPAGSPLIAYSHDGDELWRYDLGPYTHGQGGGTSPITYKDMVIVSNDGKGNSYLLAVNRKTGKEIWKFPRLGKRACFSTPCVYQPNGRDDELIFTHCFEGVIGVNPADGELNWRIDVFGTHSQRAVGSPVIYKDLIISNSGARFGEKNVVAVAPIEESKKLVAKEAYRLTKTAPHVPTVIVHEDRLYLWSDVGVLTCADANTGKTISMKRIGGNYFSSPIIVNDKLYNVDVDGKVIVTTTGEAPEVLARNELGESSRATPAVANGVLYLRTDSKLFSIGGK